MNGEAAKLGLNPSALAQYQDNIKIGKSGKPELYFANGGDVPEWDINDTTKAAVLGSAAALPAAAKAASAVPTITGSGGAVTAGQVAKGLVSGAWDGAKAVKNTNIPGISGNVAKSGLGRGYVLGSLAATAADVATTPTEQYRERFGLGDYNPDDGDGMRFAKDLGVRTLGAASDLGNNMTLRLAGKHLYRDMQSNDQENQTAIPQNKPNTANKLVAEKPVATPAVDSVAKANTPTTNLPSMFADTPAQNTNKLAGNPYAIQQKGNSFSYADAGAAAQARANGVPELQSSGIQPVQGVRGIKEFMANTREMGPNEQQIQNALAQREMNVGLSMQGYSNNPVQAPQRNDLQEAERQAVIRAANTPIAGARGLTANQVRTLSDLQQGEDNRANQRYTTDANNVAALQREAMGQAGQNLRTTMGEQGANYRTELGERGTNNRFAATNDLANRQYTQDQVDKMPARMKEQAELNLLKQYDAATTDEQRKAIAAKRDFLMGRTQEQQAGKLTPFKQYEVTDDKGNVTQPAKDYFIDERGRTIDPLAGQLPPIGENPAVKAIMDNNSLSKDEKMAKIVGLGYTNT
jgi:hypothetical protein